MAAMTPERRRHALAANAVGDTLRLHDEWLRLSVREDIARAVLAAIDADDPAARCVASHCVEGDHITSEPQPEAPPVDEPNPPKQDSTGWAWACHRFLCPHAQDGYWTRRGALRARDRHLATHTTGADHA